MKKQAIFFLAILAIVFTACQNDASNDAATANAAVSDATAQQAQANDVVASGDLAINTESSVIEWIGSKPTGGGHNGTIKLQSGVLNMYNGNITGGKIVLDMNSIAVTDIAGDDKADLESHLKDADFFEVNKYPIGVFEFGSTQPLEGDRSGAKHLVAGSLILKGIPKAIRIPFNISSAGGKVTVETPEFAINRTEWGVQYKSSVIGTIKEKMIDDFVKLKIKLVADMPVQ